MNFRFQSARWGGTLPAALSGALMAAAYEPWNAQSLAWIAWLPLLSRLVPSDPSRSCPDPFRLGFIAGLVFWIGTIHWLVHVTYAGMLALAAFLSLYTGVWAWWIARLRSRWPVATGPSHLLLATLGAAGWVALEWARGWILGGFPWNFAAVSQYRNLALIQVAAWTGATGVSFVVIFFNLAIWLTWRRLKFERFAPRSWRYEFTAALLLVAFCLMLGLREILAFQQGAPSRRPLRVALVQPDIPQSVKYELMSLREQARLLEQRTREAAMMRPDLILWPETALVSGPTYNEDVLAWLRRLEASVKTPILFGAMDATRGGGATGPLTDYFNAAMLIRADGSLSAPYRKIHLVPFGEYIPFEGVVPGVRSLSPISGGLQGGGRPVLIEAAGVKMGVVICFEDTFPKLSRDLAREGAQVLVNLTNDAWFGKSPGAAMHAANSVFRAIETHRPLIRCANSGVTVVIQATGQMPPPAVKPFASGFATAVVEYDPSPVTTWAVRYGDWFPWSCLALCAVAAWMTRRSRVKSPDCPGPMGA